MRTSSNGRIGGRSASGVPSTGTSALIGDAARMGLEAGQSAEHRAAIRDRLAHPDDAAAAQADPLRLHARQGLEPLRVGPGRDDLAVELLGRVEVVVVRGQPRLGELARLLVGEHPQGRARLEPQRAHPAHHLEHIVERRTSTRVPPRRAHAEPARPVVARLPRRAQNLVEPHHALRLDLGLVVRALRAITAVLGARAGLHRQQRAELHRVGPMVLPMHALRAKEQLGQRQIMDRPDLLEGPIGADSHAHVRAIGSSYFTIELQGPRPGAGCQLCQISCSAPR